MQKKNTNGQKPKVFLECLVGSGFVCVIIIRALIIMPAQPKSQNRNYNLQCNHHHCIFTKIISADVDCLKTY